MIRNSKLLKAISAFLILETLVNTVAPTISWALTAGPTAPEATSFEPVDTTDMVNLNTGDFSYNLPLIEIPGPSGGYPLSLSYHSGIQTNEDASWVGLGWSLNPGAINRNVNGFADDHSDVMNSNRFYWDGGSTEIYDVGVTIGVGGTPASFSAGLTFSNDTYQGFGSGLYMQGGTQVGPDEDIAIGISMRTNPYGGASFSVTSGALSVETDFHRVDGRARISVPLSPLDIDLSTRTGISSSMSVGGASFSSSSSRSGRISSRSSGFQLPIPVLPGLGISLGYNYQRYWIDEVDNTSINGTLYFPTPTSTASPTTFDTRYFDNKAFDTYRLLDPEVDGGIVDHSDPDKVEGGSFPDFDNYQVVAQGIYGNMRPYYFQKHLYKGNDYTVSSDGQREYQKVQFDLAHDQVKDNRRAEFRFINDFSNRFEHDPGEVTVNNVMEYNFASGTNTKIGENALTQYTSNSVQGSKNIQWFTNAEIIDKANVVVNARFMGPRASVFNRSTAPAKQVGGFTVTNESGVKYHFGLPAYSYDEYSQSRNTEGTTTFNEFYKREKYAYTWYLTGVTGPDYVDRGPTGEADGILNEYDWGYWVEFEYGKWTDIYAWRNPSEGATKDLDQKFENFSEGKKELYYLDAIRTKTHTAFFVKDIRHDAKGSVYSYRNISNRGFEKNKVEITDVTRYGQFTPKHITNSCDRSTLFGAKEQHGDLDYYSKPTSSLKLEEIILIQNKDLPSSVDKSNGIDYNQNYYRDWTVTDNDNMGSMEQCDFRRVYFNHHLYQNVFDKYDLAVAANANIRAKAIRSVRLTTDYELCPETANSFDFAPLKAAEPSEQDASYPRKGKLTLKSIQFFGKGGLDHLPATKFEYELEDPQTILTGLSVDPYSGEVKLLKATGASFEVGDIIKFISDSKDCYGSIKKIETDYYLIKVLGRNTPKSGEVIASTTKNPPYNKEAYDMWGNYKSDYNAALAASSETLARNVTDASAKNIDAWSLRRILTPTGAKLKINYEPDHYKKPVLYKANFAAVSGLEKNSAGKYVVMLYDNLDEYKGLSAGDVVSYKFLIAYPMKRYLEAGELHTFETTVYEGTFEVESVYKSTSGATHIVTTTNFDSYFVQRPNVIGQMVWVKEFNSYVLISKFYQGAIRFLAGNVSFGSEEDNIGGGLRVKSLELGSLTSIQKTNYSYDDSDGIGSSGVVSYEPSGLAEAVVQIPTDGPYWQEDSITFAKNKYNKSLYKDFSNLITVSREVPPPGVMYGRVKVEGSTVNGTLEVFTDNYSVYEFQVFEEPMVQVLRGSVYDEHFDFRYYDDLNFLKYNNKRTRRVFLRDFTATIGGLKRVALYDRSGNIINETENEYLHDVSSITPPTRLAPIPYVTKLQTDYNGQGIIQETFTDGHFEKLTDLPNKFSLIGLITKREQYPVIQLESKTTNYKSGIVTSSTTKAFDYYSGQVTKSVTDNGYGTRLMTESIPAYRIQDYSEMGPNGKNMLTQEAASYAYHVDANDNVLGLASGAVQTWSKGIPALEPGQTKGEAQAQTGIWRKSSTYTFVGDNSVPVTANGFYATTGSYKFNSWMPSDVVPATWKKGSEITLYDVESHPIEAKDLNGIYAATKFNREQTRVIATATNCAYNDFSYSGVEEPANVRDLGNQISIDATASIFDKKSYTGNERRVHTGDFSVKTSSKGFVYDNAVSTSKSYTIRVWTTDKDAIFRWISNGQETDLIPTVQQSGDWYLLTATAFVTGNLKVWCQTNKESYFDDFRVAPTDAVMTSFVYNSDGELSYILDNNNLFSQFCYDKMGRLEKTYKETLQYGTVHTSTNSIHYANED